MNYIQCCGTESALMAMGAHRWNLNPVTHMCNLQISGCVYKKDIEDKRIATCMYNIKTTTAVTMNWGRSCRKKVQMDVSG